ncbi:MAG: hypothetical protein WC807_07940 [Hyphomicrobium sp.]
MKTLLVTPKGAVVALALASAGAGAGAAVLPWVAGHQDPDAAGVTVVEGSTGFVPVTVGHGTPGALTPSTSGFDDPAGLTRALQKELARVGCYDGPISGRWTTRSRKAMEKLLASANARLPSDKPDPVLLALAKGETEGACDTAETAPRGPDIRRKLASTELADAAATAQPPEAPVETTTPAANSEPVAVPPSLLEQTAYEGPAAEVSPREAIAANAAAPLVTSALPAVTEGAGVPKREGQNTARKWKRYKGPSFARSMNKSFRVLKRTLKALF